jgi:hypothetical protein
MSKMGSYHPFGHLKHKLWPKKKPGVKESNWQFDSRPLKVGNWPDFLAFRWRETYHWKALDDGYNFFSNLIAIRGLHRKLCAPKVVGNPVVGIFGTPTWESWDKKSHLDVAPVERHKVYYKGEGGGFPQVRAMVSLVCPSCLWFVLAPKVLQLCTNHFMLVSCRPMWVIEACQFLLVPSRSSSMLLYPSIILRARERPWLLVLLLFSVWDSYLSPSRS